MVPPADLLDIALNHHQSGRVDEAEQLYRRILQVTPQDHNALHLAGVAAHQLGRHTEAILLIRQALAIDGIQPKIHNSLGAVHQALGNLAEAATCFQQAAMLDMDYPEAHNNLGLVLLAERRPSEALPAFQRALALKPDYAAAHNNLGTALYTLGRNAEAVDCYERALQLNSGFWEAYFNLGNARQRLGQLEEAIACFTSARRLVPKSYNNVGNLLLLMHYRAGITMDELAAAHAEFERAFGAPLHETWKPHDNDRDPERRLKVGFLSPDLHTHPVGFFIVGLLEHIDQTQLDIACYSNSSLADDLTTRIRSSASLWRDVWGWSDEQLDAQIREDGIDILFDLAGHTQGNRLLVFARKPAPIQISWAGYPGTTGLEAIDYILADRHEIPPAAETHYRERVLRMPDAYVCYEPPAYAPAVSPLPALTRGHVTFGSFSNPVKLNTEVVAVWARILAQVPQSRLLLRYQGLDDPDLAAHLKTLFAGHGIDPDRVSLQGKLPHPQLLELYTEVDIALDPFPYNGGLTTLESLWMGVPVITWPGETFAGRHSLTHLTTIGLTDTVASDPDHYVALAASLAGNLPGLASLRAGLRDRVASSPLCDGERFAGSFLHVLRDVWREWASA
jgi:protein O-GlcNAc transferase